MSREPAPEPALDGLYLYAVARSRGPRLLQRDSAVTRVRYRELEALVRPVPYTVPEMDRVRIEDHQRVVNRAMQRGTVLPAPFGLVFQGRRALLRFMEDQYIVLDEGLAFLDGHWEMRLHIMGDPDSAETSAMAAHLYTDLRRICRAAIPLPLLEGRVLSAAFLVERDGWIRFVEQADTLNRAHPELVFDLTGPWPPYDFVKIQV